MKLCSVEKSVSGGKVRLSALVDSETKGRGIELYFEYDERHADLVSDTADAFVPLLLVPAMVYGEDLDIEPPISKKLFHGLGIPQSIQTSWFPQLKPVKVSAPKLIEREGAGTGVVGSFFSCGVDSFYTFLKNRTDANPYHPRITHLIMMQGYENPLEIDRAGEFKRSLLEAAANDFKVDWIHGKANFRSIFDIKWGDYYHGAGLAAAGLSLSQGMGTVYVPSSCNWNDLFPWGSHPLLEKSYASEALDILHDGCEARRVDKTRRSVEMDERFLDYLYVCVGKGRDNINCGGCNKCIRTLTTLAILGKLDRARTFERNFYDGFEKKFTRKTLKKQRSLIQAELDFALENYGLSKELGHPDARMREFLEYFIRRAKRALLWKELRGLVNRSQ